MRGEAWVVDGNYTSTLGQLDSPDRPRPDAPEHPREAEIEPDNRVRPPQYVSQTELWSGNRETWRNAFFTRDSLFLWAVQTHRRFRRVLPGRLAQDEFSHIHLIRLRTPRQVRRWLDLAAR